MERGEWNTEKQYKKQSIKYFIEKKKILNYFTITLISTNLYLSGHL